MIERPLLGAGACHADDEGHLISFRYVDDVDC
jgi:hypothetical protein